MSRRFLLLRAFPPSSSRCQPSSGHDARENDAQFFHRADASNLHCLAAAAHIKALCGLAHRRISSGNVKPLMV
jgi:hypothetical protein